MVSYKNGTISSAVPNNYLTLPTSSTGSGLISITRELFSKADDSNSVEHLDYTFVPIRIKHSISSASKFILVTSYSPKFSSKLYKILSKIVNL